jgi:hypothetical protein
MNLEHCRKDAKRLLRAVAAGDADALARARAVLGERVQQRFALSDAQHVVAGERGYRSWPLLVREAADPARNESIVNTGLEYRPGDPVRVWILRRERRVSVSDHGVALRKARAGLDAGRAGAGGDWARDRAGGDWAPADARVRGELDVNITRGGVVWLPVVAVGPSVENVARRIGRASLIFFQKLLESEQV